MIKDRRAQAQFISYDSLSVSRNMNVDETGKGIFHPADVDAIIQFENSKSHPLKPEYNQAILIYEFKRRNAVMATGQRILLEGLADAVQKSGGFSLVAIVRHDIDNPKIDVDGGRGIVTEYYYDGEWRTCHPMSAIRFTDLFLIGAGLKGR